MHFLPVKSTSLAAIAYESPRQRLHIHFQDRSVYTYFDVPAHVYQQLLEAPSKGLYFNARIRGKFILKRSEDICAPKQTPRYT